MTGEGGHNRNWACGCKPGVLGPPVSPIPPMLRSTIEQLGYGPPLSWKLEQDSLLTKLALKWTMNTGQPSNTLAMFPPPLMTAIASLQSSPASWSLEQVNNHLLCCLTWTFTPPSPPSTATASTLNDSGYLSSPESPASPTRTNTPDLSPLRLDFPSPTVDSLKPSTNLNKQTQDASTATTAEMTATTSSQTSPPTAMEASAQTSTNPNKQTQDASTDPIAVTLDTSSASCQTSTPATLGIGVQTSTFTPNTYQDAATLTTGPVVVTSSSQTLQPVSKDSTTQTLTADPAPTTNSTSTQASYTFIPAYEPPATNNSTTTARKKKKKGKPAPVSSTDVATEYDPPTTQYRHCRLCHNPNFDDTRAIAHLLTCDDLPRHLLHYRTTFFQQQSQITGIPIESLQTQTALFLTTHRIDNPDPDDTHSTKDYLIGQLFLSALPEFQQVEHYHATLCKFTHHLVSATLKHVHLDPTADHQQLFYLHGVDPLHDDDEPDHPHHPFDLLDLYPDDESHYDDDDECYGYDDEF
ncbi:Hypothetical predicted protein [Paramuricea clavata]|uniref:Uncharacterized protein n=1 Tax=Paramuricea clavata TaxID=317549 RepID=A0A6S7JHP1_PARCT|nr:Hypothetical predicted protein [Paramuricea clavata]